MKISTYIFLSFLFILLLFSVTTYINFRLSEEVQQNADYYSTSSEVMKLTTRFQRNILNTMSGLRGFLLTGEKSIITTYDSAVVENENILKDLSVLITDSSQKKLLGEIQQINNMWIDHYAEPLRQGKMMSHVNDSNLAAYNKLYRERYLSGEEAEIHAKLQQRFREFSTAEYGMREIRRGTLTESIRETRRLSIALTVLSFVVGLVIVTFLIKRISNRIGKMVKLANTIASGNYNHKIVDTSKDELTALSDSLNHMSSELATNMSLLKTKNEELDQFAHIVSHDLKGPLRGIDNVISWIEEDHKQELSPTVQEYMQLIKGRVTRTENLIQGILSYARIDKEEIQKEEVDVNELIKDVLDSLPFNPKVKVEAGRLPRLFTEKVPLFQVFANLISNSIKYSDKDQGLVKVYSKDLGDRYQFFVQDNGPGIAENYHERIFVIFQTLTERDSFESTGVGLAIVKKILDGRKETIKIESEVNKGATFSFTWSKS